MGKFCSIFGNGDVNYGTPLIGSHQDDHNNNDQLEISMAQHVNHHFEIQSDGIHINDPEREHIINFTNESGVTSIISNSGQFKTTSIVACDPTTIERNAQGWLRFQFKIEVTPQNDYTAYSLYSERITSSSFKCRGIPFSLVVVLNMQGTRTVLNPETVNSIELFLHCGSLLDCEVLVETKLSIINQIDNENTITREINKRLFKKNSQCGFKDFILRDSNHHGYFVSNSMLFDVEIESDPPSFNGGVSRQTIGYVGIRNQGSTCYLNSLLEVLYFLNKFRAACYRIPTELDDTTSTALALQKTFYELQFASYPVSTKTLTHSFGWSLLESHMQHDIQELMRFLLDKIECRMKSTKVGNVVSNMFEGKFVTCVKCRDIDYNSQREEIFSDIQLSLENVTNLYEAFDKVVSTEVMDEDNKYFASGHGFQVAEKGIHFLELPQVMFLHLLRFRFDAAINATLKNNNRFEFYEKINLSKYINHPERHSTEYTLFAVLTHSGNGHCGHYVAYVNPLLKGKWLKFDDDIISLCHKSDVIEKNFGDDDFTNLSNANAYMLVYVRDSDVNEVFAPINPNDIPDDLSLAVQMDSLEDDWASVYNSNIQDIFVLLDTHLESEIMFEDTKKELSLLPKISLAQYSTLNNFMDQIKELFKVEDDQFRIWPIVHEATLSYPCFIDYNNSQNTEQFSFPCTIWLEMALPGHKVNSFDPTKDTLVFYYYFCADQSKVFYVSHGYHDRMSQVGDLIPILNELMNWKNRDIVIYERYTSQQICKLDFSECLNLQRNSTKFIVFELYPSKKQIINAKMYYDDLESQVTLILQTLKSDQEEYEIKLSVNTLFSEFMKRLSILLNYDKDKIQIFKKLRYLDRNIKVTSTKPTDTLASLLCCESQGEYALQYALIKCEQENLIYFEWLTMDLKQCKTYEMIIYDGDSISKIIERSKKYVDPLSNNVTGKLRLIFVRKSIAKFVSGMDEVYGFLQFPDAKDCFRIEEVPKGEETLLDDEIYVSVVNDNVALEKAYSFVTKISTKQSWKSIKVQLCQRLQLSEDESQNVKCTLEEYFTSSPLIYDDQCLNDVFYKRIPEFFIRLKKIS